MSAATHFARPVGVLVQDHGAPDAYAWASVVASGMVSLSPAMSPERETMALALRQKLVALLCEAFHEAQAKSSKTDIIALVTALLPHVRNLFVGTPWEMFGTSDVVLGQFEAYLTNNLAQAAHLNLLME